MNKLNCLICGDELIYLNESKKMRCEFCNELYESGAMCKNEHYICDKCHSKDTIDVISTYCMSSDSTTPMELVVNLMKHPSVKVHGPEHHYLVPATLISAYCNKLNKENLKEKLLSEAIKRSNNVLGGFCGFYGACGAGVGTGIFMSLILEATPLTTESWGLCNLMTSRSLENIGRYGGPRCCKRDSFTSIKSAIDFIKEHLNIELDTIDNLKCEFSNYNNECLMCKCSYY